MRQGLKLAMICVSVSIKGRPRFMAFAPFCLSPKGRLSTPGEKASLHSHLGNALWQKATSGPYLRHFGTYHRPNLAAAKGSSLMFTAHSGILEVWHISSQRSQSLTAQIIMNAVVKAMTTTLNGWSTTFKCGQPGNGILLRAACAKVLPDLS